MTEVFNSAIPGSGPTFAFTPAGGSSTSVTQIKSITPPGVEVGTWDSTGVASTAKEYLPLLPDGGEFSMTIIHDLGAASHIAINTAIWARTLCACVVTLPATVGPGATGTTHTYSYSGYFTGLTPGEMDPEGYLTTECKMKVTGVVTEA